MVRASDRLGEAGPAAGGHEGAEALGIEAGEVGEARRMAELAP